MGMLRWSTAAAACLLLGGVRGAVVAASEEAGQAERRSLKMTKDESLEKMVFDFTDAALFGEEQAASWWESSDTPSTRGRWRRFTFLSPSLLHSSEGSRLTMPRHLISPRSEHLASRLLVECTTTSSSPALALLRSTPSPSTDLSTIHFVRLNKCVPKTSTGSLRIL